jgi:hypothetical protein
MTTPAISDFVQVRLSAAGAAFAGAGAQIRIANGHFSYLFTEAQPTRVLTSEWRRTLSLRAFKGVALLEIAPAAAPAPLLTPAASARANRSARTISPPASHTDAPQSVQSKTVQPAAPSSAAPTR